ncbi:hypothetical protein CQ040_15770 [Microbacterium sp. MYb54]|nr:hypothetical protein CQ032_15120 [Microbacterium sp. MYb43]PQZ75097.1 hypothetical protein CQ031_14475 [Microbacterium sp. MYb40]PRB19391.1 hypothetical protein CQ040_15770 [Microbacterium sp. MYb54]PRB24592.1 hypothetical protein CQ037_16275 [Microbacterium sp. MYb50]PRB63703.1 hypothetical protein CQ021_15880 [Microbacterium sp. MYb24]PRB66131.1 hypothetical protein CQ027_19640 [Microbacterium sp. MYb32]
MDRPADVYVGPTAPESLASNWIPAGGKGFWLMFRFCGPQLPLLKGPGPPMTQNTLTGPRAVGV